MRVFKIFINLIILKDPLTRFQLLRRLGKVLVPDYQFKWPMMEWWEDDFFCAYLKTFEETDKLNTDRRWMLYQLMRLVHSVPGDTAECGVFAGAGSYLICKMNEKNDNYSRYHHGFDSFEGLSKPSEYDGPQWSEKDLSCPIEITQKNLASFSNVKLYKGWIPERFVDVADYHFCFIHIDVDLFDPTLKSLEFFYPRTNHGGIIICDDYGFSSCPGATQAVEQFLEDKPEKMISMSGGGGFLIKGRSVANPIQHIER